MIMSDDQLEAYFEGLCKKRGTESYFHRFEQDSVTSDGLRLHLDVIEQDRERPTLLFMPGTNAYALLYGDFLTAVADKGYNIVGFDPRGHGRSEGGRGSYTVPELLTDLRSALAYTRDRFGDPVVAAGSSQGGITVFYLAAAGDPVAGVICHNLADLADPKSVRLTRYPRLSRLARPLVMRLARLLPEWKVPMITYLDLAAEPVRDLGDSKTLLYNDPLLVPFIRLKGMASLSTEKLPCPVEQIKTPVLILHGEKDTIFPTDYVEDIYRRLTCRKTLKLYPGFPHYFLVDEVPSILPDVVEWIEGACN